MAMAARPRRLADHDLIDAAARAVAARGDGSWSLADVAAATGMSPAALVKRFGSKSGLLRAIAARWVDQLPAYAPSSDPVQVIRDWVDAWTDGVSDPETARGHLTLLFDEIVDPTSRRLLIEGQRRQAEYLAAALADAHDRGLIDEQLDDAAELWLDLLSGAAVRGALDDPRIALTRAKKYIHNQLDQRSTR
jgi:AcrR family transcriptional regulator